MISFGTAVRTRSETSDSIWKSPPEKLTLEKDEIHVWLVSINSEDVAGFEHIISDDERARAMRFHFPQHKMEYVFSRIYLRTILSKYAAISPHLIRFNYTDYGKPAIANRTNSNLKFNFSHSNGFALYAVTLDNEIGIDLELIQQSDIDDEIAVKSLTSNELARFTELPARERIEFFYKCWTRKEAYSKALGKGLIYDPNKIETLHSFDKPIFESKYNKVFSKTFDSFFIDLPAITGFAAGLAVEGREKTNLKCWSISSRTLK